MFQVIIRSSGTHFIHKFRYYIRIVSPGKKVQIFGRSYLLSPFYAPWQYTRMLHFNPTSSDIYFNKKRMNAKWEKISPPVVIRFDTNRFSSPRDPIEFYISVVSLRVQKACLNLTNRLRADCKNPGRWINNMK